MFCSSPSWVLCGHFKVKFSCSVFLSACSINIFQAEKSICGTLEFVPMCTSTFVRFSRTHSAWRTLGRSAWRTLHAYPGRHVSVVASAPLRSDLLAADRYPWSTNCGVTCPGVVHVTCWEPSKEAWHVHTQVIGCNPGDPWGLEGHPQAQKYFHRDLVLQTCFGTQNRFKVCKGKVGPPDSKHKFNPLLRIQDLDTGTSVGVPKETNFTHWMWCKIAQN